MTSPNIVREPGPTYRRPISVLVVIFTDDSQVLLLRRYQPFDFWQSVTGSLNNDESHADAAARELQEETGFIEEGELRYSEVSRRFVIDPRWRDRFAPGVVENVEFEWRYRLRAVSEIKLNKEEHAEYRWLPIDEAIETVWSWTNRDAIKQLKADLS
ncbi:MAG: dihydroneopterin triphosphate diphosphatase [Woeseiaceae bacterium]